MSSASNLATLHHRFHGRTFNMAGAASPPKCSLNERCVGCGQPAVFQTQTGHYVCKQCANAGPTFSDVLDDVSAFISRFIRFTTDHQLVAVTLWTAHTYLVDRLRTTPYLHISSPEPEAGKSQLLDVLVLGWP